jgi:hypothetical protein
VKKFIELFTGELFLFDETGVSLGANVISLFTAVILRMRHKLECYCLVYFCG